MPPTGTSVVVDGISITCFFLTNLTDRFLFSRVTCHSRFYRVCFEVGDGTEEEPCQNKELLIPFIVVANDQGLLGKPTSELTEIILGPAERYEIVISFSGHSGKKVTLRNIEPTLIGPGTFIRLLLVTGYDFCVEVVLTYSCCFVQSRPASTTNSCSSRLMLTMMTKVPKVP